MKAILKNTSRFASVFLIATILSVPVTLSARPNVVLFLVDDLGWHDLGCYGETWIETPRIDEFAQSSVRFTNFYANGAVCSPTRAAIQSGQYPTRFQLTAHIPGHYRPFEKVTEPPNAMSMPEEIVTLGETMGQSGYHTGYFGKWHLGKDAEHQPENQGYQTVVRTGGSHFAPGFRAWTHGVGDSLPSLDSGTERGTYLADYLSDLTCDYIQAHQDEEFFVTVAHYGVHIPLQAKRELIDKYEAKAKADPEDPTHPVYAAMVEHIDQSFGKVLDKLDELELASNTIVIFTSDNGALKSRYDEQGHIVTTNQPLRDEKGSPYEGGVRIPTLVRWPTESMPGTVCHEPTMSIDFYPTLIEAAESIGPDQVLDGHSLLPLLRRPGSRLSRETVFWHYPHYHHSRPSSSVRARDYKLIHFFDDGSVELYNLAEDIGESQNLADVEAELVRDLLQELVIWRDETGALTPYWNERYNPKRAHEWWNKMTLEPLDLSAIHQRIRELPFDGPKGQ
tara:strand:- start:4641 stop:6161 length:1521 start_codon:yes stop_codon:yes gene_type:complete